MMLAFHPVTRRAGGLAVVAAIPSRTATVSSRLFYSQEAATTTTATTESTNLGEEPVRSDNHDSQQVTDTAAATSNPPRLRVTTQNAYRRAMETKLKHFGVQLPAWPRNVPAVSAAVVSEYAPYMVATYSRPPPVFVHGHMSWLWDVEGQRYLDFTAGIAVNSLGHCDKEFSRILRYQGSTLIHASNLYYNPWTGTLSKLLVEKTRESGGMHDAAAVFVCNSGSEANEAGIKFARKVGKVLDPSGEKHEIVSFTGAFHGRTMGALSATPNPKYQAPFAPMVPGFRVGTYNDVAGIDELVTEKTCSVIVEPIQGEGGVQVATDEFLIKLAKRCREVGALLHYDEIQCGLSRTGSFWAHGRLPKEAHPDILTTAKALGNGIPIGATIVNANVAEKIKVGDHGTTFGGNPLACRLATYVVHRLTEPELQTNVVAMGAVLARGLAQLREKYPELITEIRGRGLILGLQLTRDPTDIVNACLEKGLLVITAGTNTLRFVPALNITEKLIVAGLKMLDSAIASVLNPSSTPEASAPEASPTPEA